MTFATKALTGSALAVLSMGTVASAGPALNGAGATFPAPIYQRWFQDLAASGGAKVNYQSVGSGAGVRQYIAGTVDFGATDEPIKDSEAAKVSRGVVQFPAVGGTIAVAYNKPGCDLKLTQKQVADIFLGTISDWSQLKCGKGKISVAHRSDGSGTTFAFTNSLSSFSPEWKSKVGEGKSVKWPVGVGGKGNEGVAGILTNTPGSIGYVNQSFVKAPCRRRPSRTRLASSSSPASRAVRLPSTTSVWMRAWPVRIPTPPVPRATPSPRSPGSWPSRRATARRPLNCARPSTTSWATRPRAWPTTSATCPCAATSSRRPRLPSARSAPDRALIATACLHSSTQGASAFFDGSTRPRIDAALGRCEDFGKG